MPERGVNHSWSGRFRRELTAAEAVANDIKLIDEIDMRTRKLPIQAANGDP
jgi:hypothetical protein